jgi:hypothetical protein
LNLEVTSWRVPQRTSRCAVNVAKPWLGSDKPAGLLSRTRSARNGIFRCGDRAAKIATGDN